MGSLQRKKELSKDMNDSKQLISECNFKEQL